jgi:extradiol dioxygenase family protein
VRFVVEPRVRYAGQVGEQATMFFRDPSGNPIELKAFRRPEEIFAR